MQVAYAEVPAGTPGAAAPKQPSALMSMVPLIFIFGVFYFLLIRPQQKKMKDHKKLLDTLKPGDTVVTSSGIYAAVVSVGERTLELRIADNVKIKVQKSAVSEIISQSSDAAV